MNNDLIKTLSAPLYSAKGWLKFLGVILILGGILSALTIVGILVAWIPIWQGVLLFQTASAVEQAYLAGSEDDLLSAQQKIKTYFIIMAILMLISIIFSILGSLFGAMMFGSMASGMMY